MIAVSALPVRPSHRNARFVQGVNRVEDGEFERTPPLLESPAKRLAGERGKPKELARALLYLAIAYLGLTQEGLGQGPLRSTRWQRSGPEPEPKVPSKVIYLFRAGTQGRQATRSHPPPKPDPGLDRRLLRGA